MKKVKFIIFVSSLFLGKTLLSQEIVINHIKETISFLASDSLHGRGTSSPDEEKAARYLAKKFKEYNLQPKGNDGFIYNFTFKTPSTPHDTVGTGKPRKGRNVAAFLNNHGNSTIVIGAHFDHLGLGHDHNSLDANPEGKIHNGADDNASGTAGVLELARNISENRKNQKFNFLFLCFSGEELGLIGSKKWCENPTLPLDSINYMINLDMIGRLNDSTRKIIVYGVGTSPVWVPMLDEISGNFKIKKDSSGIGPSDQTSFYLKNIPVLHFFTGQHSDYHKPSDDIEKINFPGEVDVLNYILKLVEKTNALPKLAFSATRSPQQNSNGFKVTLGVMPDYVFEGKGMRIDGVTEGKPAFKAGIKTGDVIIQLGENKVESVESYMKALSNYKKGDHATVEIKRQAEILKLEVVF